MSDENLTEAEEVGLQISNLIQEKNERIWKLEKENSNLRTELYETKTYRNELQDCLKDDRCSYYSLCKFLTKHDNALLERYFSETRAGEAETDEELL